MANRAIHDVTAAKLVAWLLDKCVSGIPPLCGCEDLANEYLRDSYYEDHDERVRALINWETAKSFSTGFITGAGGGLTLPIAVPAALGASWVIQARMAAAIAVIYGHKPTDDRVRT